MEIEEILTKIAGILKHLKIPYIITGGMAVSVWGRPRYTADIDIVVEMLEKNIESLAKELLSVDKDVYVSEDAMRQALQNKGEFNFVHPQSGLKLDFWVVKDSFEKLKIKRAKIKVIDGEEVSFSSPEDLIISKLDWYKLSNSTRQLEDIESVLRISKVDLEYIKKWASKRGTIDILNKLIKGNKL